MLLHSVSEPGVGMYVNQVVYTLESLDVEAMASAWNSLIERYEILRSSFHWQDLERPEQRIHQDVKIEPVIADWKEERESAIQKKLVGLLRDDREQGFDFEKAPLLRVFFIRITEKKWYYIFSHHHLLLDGWSKNQINTELRAFYDAHQASKTISLPPVKQFCEYIDYLEKRDKIKDQEFWKEYLNGFSGLTPLPCDRNRAEKIRYRRSFGEWTLHLDDRESEQIALIARKCHVTLNTILVGAWAILLGRYVEVNDVVIGMLVSGRPNDFPGINEMVGMFLNAIPVRIRIDECELFADWIQGIQANQNQLREQEQTPLRLIQEWCSLPYGNPLYECIVVNTNTMGSGVRNDTPQVKEKSGRRAMASSVQQNVPLHLDMETIDDRVAFKMSFDARRFNEEAIARLMTHFHELLKSITLNPASRIEDISFLSDKERQTIIHEWNNTEVPISKGIRAIHDLFTASQRTFPKRIAARLASQFITYDELGRCSNKICSFLNKLGVVKGDRIGLLMGKTIEMTAAIIAASKLGCVYVGLDKKYPRERIEFMARDSDLKLILSDSSSVQQQYADRSIYDISAENADWRNEPDEEFSVDVEPQDPAYIIYTSGSTGRPKGVVVPHRVPINRILTEPYPVEPDESFCSKTSISFVDSIWELYIAWSNGLTVTLIPEDILLDTESLVALLGECQATRIVMVPSLMRSILDLNIDLAKTLPKLKHWISSGERLSDDLYHKFNEVLPGRILTNLYGTSEIWDATRCDSLELSNSDFLPIGRPMGNVKAYIVDKQLRPLPVGISGELLIGGAGIPIGYWKQEELTREKFIHSPFGQNGELLYKTGDTARWLPDGNIELLGRQDFQIKIRGYRVEIEEIEQIIRQTGLVHNVVVWKSESESLEAAYVSTEAELQTDALRTLLRTLLPEYMIPCAWYRIEKIYLTPNGKTDRKKCKSLAESAPASSQTSQEGVGTESEDTILSVWKELLRVSTLGYDDNVFRLGAHSLTAARASVRLAKEFNKKIPLKILFENPTPRLLARWIDESSLTHENDSHLPEIVRLDRLQHEPLSYNQRRLWFLHQLDPSTTAYTVHNSLRIHGTINTGMLERSIEELINRHESLRTTFINREGTPYQVIHDIKPFRLEVIDLRVMQAEYRRRAVSQIIKSHVSQAWDLKNGPLFRTKLIVADELDGILLITMNHIITDGHSMGIFSRELNELYKSLCEGRQIITGKTRLQYADYSRWEQEWMKGDSFQAKIRFWKSLLEDINNNSLPEDYDRAALKTHAVEQLVFDLGDSSYQKIHALAREIEGTSFMILLAGFSIFLSIASGQKDVCLGTPVANRDREELQSIIGFFANTAIIKKDVDRSVSIADFAMRMKSRCLEVFDHAIVPLDMIVDEIKPIREPNRNPLFQIMFVTQDSAAASGGVIRLDSVNQFQKATSDFDILLLCQVNDDKYQLTLQYKTALYKKNSAERFVSQLKQVYNQMLQDWTVSIDLIPLCSAEEKKQLLFWGHGEGRPLSVDTIQQWVSRNSKNIPESIAVESGDDKLSYYELECRSNELACYIQSLQGFRIGPVAFCLGRSTKIVVTMIAILKTGCSLVAIDPDYPDERIMTMLDDTSCHLIIHDNETEPRLGRLPISQDILYSLDNELHRQGGVVADVNAEEPTIDSIAYISFTSGSTGKPKGVLVNHKNVIAMIEAQIIPFELDSTSRVLQVLSLSFDAGLAEIFRGIAAGATIVIVNRELLLPGKDFIELLEKKEITNAAIPPVMLKALPIEAAQKLDNLKTIITGGEQCAAQTARIWGANRSLVIGYGTTETSNGSVFAKGWDLSSKPPLGRPLPNVQLYVLSDNLQLQPQGVPGEIYISGMGVSRGYLNNEDLTSKVFIRDPFSSDPNAKMYKTGDRGRWLNNGELEYLGRTDSQVKIRGHRIEIDEVIQAVESHPEISQCVVTVSELDSIKRLVCYVTARTSAGSNDLTNSTLRSFAKERLPEYMVPSIFIVVKKIPVTQNGKTDFKALPQPSSSLLISEQDYIPPVNDIETRLAFIWSKVLKIEPIGRNSNFFELGGDSILSVQVVAQATALGIPITVRDIFEHQTIAQLAECSQSGTIIHAEQGDITGEVPLTPIQLWHLSKANSNPSIYNHSMIIPISPQAMSGDLLDTALSRVWRHHDGLRSGFRRDPSGRWTQFICDTMCVQSIDRISLIGIDPKTHPEYIDRVILQLSDQIDISDPPISRVVLFDRGRRAGALLCFVIHHLVTDIVSWQLIIEDFQHVVRCLLNKENVDLPAKTTSFRSWAELLVEYSSSPGLADEVPYWTRPERNLVLSLPVDHPSASQAAIGTSGLNYLQEIDGPCIMNLLRFASAGSGISVQVVLIAALSQALCKWSNQKMALIDIEGHGREETVSKEINLSRTVGWFTSFYPLFLNFSNLSCVDAKDILETTTKELAGVPNKGIGYGVLRYLSTDHALRDSLENMRHAEVALNYIGITKGPGARGASAPDDGLSIPIGQIRLFQNPNATKRHKLEIIAAITNNTLAMRWGYSPDDYSETTLRTISSLYHECLVDMINALRSMHS
jgi:amino acid adenylation domain-containing protein/non-ribosomal peptide synthase protein (TIGR01720 family)